jgi:hypothetical protein
MPRREIPLQNPVMPNPAPTRSINFVPLPYRRVAVREVDFALTARALEENLLGREAYRRTEFIVLRHHGQVAIARIERGNGEDLFSPITSAELFASPDECLWVDDAAVDVGNPSALAAEAKAVGVGVDRTLVVHGKYEHVNFIAHPEPIVIRVIDVVPPEPPKLWTMAQQVLAFADDLPAIELRYVPIDLVALAEQNPAPAYLFPCQASNMHVGAPVYFLDTRPPLQDWTLIGCERSAQFYRHFYGRDAKQVDYCPRFRSDTNGDLILTKCCLLETTIECQGNRALVPWGATLRHVEEGLRYLTARVIEEVSIIALEMAVNRDC